MIVTTPVFYSPSVPVRFPSAPGDIRDKIYQAGYQQVDPDYREGGDPREDPSNYPPPPPAPSAASVSSPVQQGPRPGEDFYPLGKAPERNEEALTSILAGGSKPVIKKKSAKIPPPKPTKKPTSFLDFLIPSFLSGRSDPEGPPPKSTPPQVWSLT